MMRAGGGEVLHGDEDDEPLSPSPSLSLSSVGDAFRERIVTCIDDYD